MSKTPKISVKTLDKARPVDAVPGCAGSGSALAYFDDAQMPLQLHLFDLAAGQAIEIGRTAVDRLAYVWRGAVEAGGVALAAGSSLVVEHGQALTITGTGAATRLLVFAAASAGAQSRAGGHVHLLPADRVAYLAPDDLAPGMSGGMHFPADCPTCELWLHANHFPGSEAVTPEQQQRGVHSHSEDEIIFVTDGEIRLGNQIHGPGTALAIAANTLYGFTPGSNGLDFVNFRARKPGDIFMADGTSLNEPGFWEERITPPQYLQPA